MEARELRIGNLVYYRDNSKILTIDNLGSKGFSTLNEIGLEYGSDDVSEYNGIPLTEEWLLKFGFEKQIDYQQREEEWGILSKSNQRMALGIYNHTGEKYLDYWCATFREDVGCGWSDLNDIEYVHQLQNLYFALMGEELSINKN